MENFYTKFLLKNIKHISEIGDFTYGNPRVLFWDDKTKLKIGKFCSFADGVTIILGGNHRHDWVTTYPFPALSNEWVEGLGIEGHPASNGDVVIGNDVWVGFGVTIMSGVRIGDGAVVGAGAVVAKDVPPYTIVAGNPAREIRKRFDQNTIDKLLKIEWWNWPLEKIKKNIKILCSNNINKIYELEI